VRFVKRHWDRIPPGTYSSTVSITLIFIYVLLLPERQETKPGNLPNISAVSEIREHGIKIVLRIFKSSLFSPRDLVVTLCDWVKQNVIMFLDFGL